MQLKKKEGFFFCLLSRLKARKDQSHRRHYRQRLDMAAANRSLLLRRQRPPPRGWQLSVRQWPLWVTLAAVLLILVNRGLVTYKSSGGDVWELTDAMASASASAESKGPGRREASVWAPMLRNRGAVPPDRFPPLSSLVDREGDENSHLRPAADVSFLLDFAIIGFAKSGTTTLARYLSALGVSILPGENCQLVVNKTARLVRHLYGTLPHDDRPDRMPRGLKCPQDASSDLSLPNYRRYFPRAKLIIGIRSPVSFFESFYNFRAVNNPWTEMLPASKLARRCIPGSLGICGWRASFGDFLYKFGKTPGTDEERELLELNLDRVGGVGNIFLYELGQLADSDEARARRFRQDLGAFLGLEGEMPPIPHINTAGRFDYIEPWREEIQERKIDICDEDFVRSVLLDKAQRTSKWIRRYFLNSSEVFASSPEYLEDLLEGWMTDGCAP